MSDKEKFNNSFFEIGLTKLAAKLADYNVEKTTLHVIGGFVMLQYEYRDLTRTITPKTHWFGNLLLYHTEKYKGTITLQCCLRLSMPLYHTEKLMVV